MLMHVGYEKALIERDGKVHANKQYDFLFILWDGSPELPILENSGKRCYQVISQAFLSREFFNVWIFREMIYAHVHKIKVENHTVPVLRRDEQRI